MALITMVKEPHTKFWNTEITGIQNLLSHITDASVTMEGSLEGLEKSLLKTKRKLVLPTSGTILLNSKSADDQANLK